VFNIARYFNWPDIKDLVDATIAVEALVSLKTLGLVYLVKNTKPASFLGVQACD